MLKGVGNFFVLIFNIFVFIYVYVYCLRKFLYILILIVSRYYKNYNLSINIVLVFF